MRMLGLQTWTNTSISTGEHKTMAGKITRIGDSKTRCQVMDPNGLLSDPSCRGSAGMGGAPPQPTTHTRLLFNSFKGHTLT